MSFDGLSYIFEADKAVFLDHIEKSIKLYITSTGKQCIAIVEKIPKPGQYPPYALHKHELHMGPTLPKFAEVLIKFIRRKRHGGHDLDSALTEPILKIIEEKYVELYNFHGEEISSEFLDMLKNDSILLNSFVERLVDKFSGKISKEARAGVVRLLVEQIHGSATSNPGHIVGNHISHFTSTAVGTQIASVAAQVLLKAIAMNMGHIIATFLASAAFKKVVMVLLHKLVVGVISAAVLHFLAANIGSAIGAGAFMWVIIPIVIGIVIEQIADFPKKLGNEVSKSVKGHLASNFGQTNKSILEKTFDEIFKGEKLLEEVANDKDVKKMIGALSDGSRIVKKSSSRNDFILFSCVGLSLGLLILGNVVFT